MSTQVSETEQVSDPPKEEETKSDWVVTGVSVGILTIFVVMAIFFPTVTGDMVRAGFKFSSKTFGYYWQILLFFTFLVSVVMMLTPWAKRAHIGGVLTPEFGRFKWIAMIMCTLLAGGGVFWAAAEPMYHYLNAPAPLKDYATSENMRAMVGLAQAFVHWGFLAWAILGTSGAIVLLYAQEKGMPLRPRSLLYPLGAKVVHSWVGTATDIVSIIAVVAGTVGPIGFLGLQVAYGLSVFFGIPNNYVIQLIVVIVLVGIASLSVVSGIDKGIQFLSRLNVWIAVGLMVVIIALGSVTYVFGKYFGALVLYVRTFPMTALHYGDLDWMGPWTIFFFGWFLGYAPLMSIFIARISRGRTVRDLLATVSIMAPLLSCFWFTALGGSAIMFEQKNPGSISEPLNKDGLPAAVIALSGQLPAATLIGGIFLILTVTFVATTTDSMSYSIAQSCTIDGPPVQLVRAVWAVIMGVAAAALISIGSGGISALQEFIVITAVPVGFVMLPPAIAMPLFTYRLAKSQENKELIPEIPPEARAH